MTGLLTQTNPIESKILEEKATASAAARRVCRGSGRKAQNSPIAKAFEIVLLFHFHRSGLCKCLFSQPKFMSSCFGLKRFRVFFTFN